MYVIVIEIDRDRPCSLYPLVTHRLVRDLSALHFGSAASLVESVCNQIDWNFTESAPRSFIQKAKDMTLDMVPFSEGLKRNRSRWDRLWPRVLALDRSGGILRRKFIDLTQMLLDILEAASHECALLYEEFTELKTMFSENLSQGGESSLKS